MMKARILFALALFSLMSFCAIPRAGTSTSPNTWTENYSGVLEAAKTTGYPIMLIIIDSQSCGHCTLFMNTTVDTDGFKSIEKDFKYYKVLLDQPYVANRNTWNTTVRRFYNYFDYGMYPLCAILKKDGSIYKAFGNSTTDKGNISPLLHDLVGKLSAEQGADDSGNGVEGDNSHDQPAPLPVVVPSAVELGAKFKGNYLGLLAKDGKVAGSFAMSVKSKGIVKINLVKNGVKAKGNAVLSGDKDGHVYCNSADGRISICYDATSGTWGGECGDCSVFAKIKAKDMGVTSAFFTAAANSPHEAGYLTCDVAKTGKMKVSGKLAGALKISAATQGVLVSAPLAAKFFGALVPEGRAAVIGYVNKPGTINGGIAVFGSDFVADISARNAEWTVEGAKWNPSQSLKVLDNMRVAVDGMNANIKITAVGDKKIAIVDSSLGWKLKANAKKGLFSGTVRNDAIKAKFEGVLLNVNDDFRGFGVIKKGIESAVIRIE